MKKRLIIDMNNDDDLTIFHRFREISNGRALASEEE